MLRVTMDHSKLPDTIQQFARSGRRRHVSSYHRFPKSKYSQKATRRPGAVLLVTATVSSTIVPASATTV